uniref:Laminin N-terminal domain-containing protein n=1 Tax=Romanomermis culicivorax TaxID=13658 RepID=A0A915K274_ROMCU
MPSKADCQICMTTVLWRILLLWSTLGIARGQVLSPPMFNLAENKRITATATCGETTSGRPLREMYCFLAGATAYSPFQSGSFSYENDFAELRIYSSPTNEKNEPKNVVEGGQSCEYCDSSIPELSHPAEYMVDGSPRWWQSPPLSRGMEYNQINITIDLEQSCFPLLFIFRLIKKQNIPTFWRTLY